MRGEPLNGGYVANIVAATTHDGAPSTPPRNDDRHIHPNFHAVACWLDWQPHQSSLPAGYGVKVRMGSMCLIIVPLPLVVSMVPHRALWPPRYWPRIRRSMARRACPPLAHNGHWTGLRECPLSGVKRTASDLRAEGSCRRSPKVFSEKPQIASSAATTRPSHETAREIEWVQSARSTL